jgi:hypothetical protein
VGRVKQVEIPARRMIYRSSFPMSRNVRDVRNNTPDILVKVRGSWARVRFWTPLLAGKSMIYNQATTTEPFEFAFCLLHCMNYIDDV